MEFPFGVYLNFASITGSHVLILVLVEFPFGAAPCLPLTCWMKVLILVLVEFPFGAKCGILFIPFTPAVLILVLVEFPFGEFAQKMQDPEFAMQS